MKTAIIATMILGSFAFANPPATAPAATPAATTAPAAKDAHAKMGHSAKATKDAATTECKNKAADGKCMDEVKK